MTGTALRIITVGFAAASLIACQQSSTGESVLDAGSSSPAKSSSKPSSSSDSQSVERPPSQPMMSDGQPRRALLSIPAIGIRDHVVAPYVGKTDDARGTRIQDEGVAASPYGPHGGVGPGGRGNYQITAHRLSSTQAFLRLPSLQVGDRAVVAVGDARYVYEIRMTRKTSFRSPRSLVEQRAAVPGRPGLPATRAYLTLSTCATPEDHAQGNYWADEFDNPEHRIDKIGVLVRTEHTA